MSVQIIEGIPRTGKSYYLVRNLVLTYFDRDKKTGELTLKPEYADLKILSNIDGLKVPHEDLDKTIEKSGGVSRFFSKDFQETIFKKYPQVLYVIDEAQDYFPSNFKDNNVFAWFRYHGHWGQEIILACHGSNLLPLNIAKLADSTIRTMPQSISFFGGKDLKYSHIVSGEKLDTKPLIKRKWVFDLYRSQNSKVIQKPKNPFGKYAILLIIAVLFGAWNVRKLFKKEEPPPKQEYTQQQTHQRQQSQRFQEPEPKEEEEIVRHPISYLIQDKKVVIFFDGGIYDGRRFPYPLEVGPFNSFYALIPRSKLPSAPIHENESNDRGSKNGGSFMQFGPS